MIGEAARSLPTRPSVTQNPTRVWKPAAQNPTGLKGGSSASPAGRAANSLASPGGRGRQETRRPCFGSRSRVGRRSPRGIGKTCGSARRKARCAGAARAPDAARSVRPRAAALLSHSLRECV
jgi:hypothetical protein